MIGYNHVGLLALVAVTAHMAVTATKARSPTWWDPIIRV